MNAYLTTRGHRNRSKAAITVALLTGLFTALVLLGSTTTA